jgi:hypothetical protein
LPQGGSNALCIGEISPKRETNLFAKVNFEKLTKLREKDSKKFPNVYIWFSERNQKI